MVINVPSPSLPFLEGWLLWRRRRQSYSMKIPLFLSTEPALLLPPLFDPYRQKSS